MLIRLAPVRAVLALLVRIILELPYLITIRGKATSMVCEAVKRASRHGRSAILAGS